MRYGLLLLALGAGLLACVLAGLAVPPPGAVGNLSREDAINYVIAALAAGACYLGAVWLIRNRRMPGWALPAILLIGLLARLLVLVEPPALSTDIYRYVWDGRVQAAGINPYRYFPVDPALAALQDHVTGPKGVFLNINRAETARTIYPPAAQALFGLIGLTVSNIWTVKSVMLAFDLATAGLALWLLQAAGRPLMQIVIWAWNPLVIWEFAGAGHIDAAAVAFSTLAVVMAIRVRPGWAGFALGMAISIKLLPAALFPAIWRRWNWRTPIAAAAVILNGYACYASAGWLVFGYLPGYAKEEGLEQGSGFLLLRLLELAGPLPSWVGALYIAGGLTGLMGLAAWISFHRPLPHSLPERTNIIVRDTLLLSAALVAVLSPHYPWYLTVLVLPAVIVPSWSALLPGLLGPLLYLDVGSHKVVWPALVFLPALALIPFDVRSTRATAVPLIAQGGP